jgi:hypothetical protein
MSRLVIRVSFPDGPDVDVLTTRTVVVRPSMAFAAGGDTGVTDHGDLDGLEEAGAHPASAISFTPDGDIAATTVQGAIVDLRDDTDAKLAGKVDGEIGVDVAPYRATIQTVASASATIDANADIVLVTYASGTCTLTARGTSDHGIGKHVLIVKANTSANKIVFAPDSDSTVNGGAADAAMDVPGSEVALATTAGAPGSLAIRTGAGSWVLL